VLFPSTRGNSWQFKGVRLSPRDRAEEKTIRREIGAFFRVKRELLGLLQKDVADAVGMHVSKLCEVEVGKAGLTLLRIRQLSRFYQVSAEEKQLLCEILFEGLGTASSMEEFRLRE